MWPLSLSFAVVCSYSLVSVSERADALLTVKPIEEVVRSFGYPIETHEIVTQDGYLLTYHRLPHGRERAGAEPLGVVLLNNGILVPSSVMLAYSEGLVYSLADAGFDVWLGNYRGNTYSRRHVTLDPDKDHAFWNISLHEFGTQDLPASIDYILGATGRRQLSYVGASMGTTMFWVLGAARPEYLSRVSTMVAIAPVARPAHSAPVNTSTKYLAEFTALNALYMAGQLELLGYNERLAALLYTACTTPFVNTACSRMIDYYNRFTSQNLDMGRFLEGAKYMPGGIATKVFLHFLQLAHSSKFQQFDYGPDGNQIVYNSLAPPEYNLKNVVLDSIYFISSDTDEIAAKEDVDWLAEQLPLRPTRLFPAVNGLGHVGIGLDKDIKTLWYQPLVHLLVELAHRTNEQTSR